MTIQDLIWALKTLPPQLDVRICVDGVPMTAPFVAVDDKTALAHRLTRGDIIIDFQIEQGE